MYVFKHQTWGIQLKRGDVANPTLRCFRVIGKKGRGWFEGYEIPWEIPYLGDEHPFKSFNVVKVNYSNAQTSNFSRDYTLYPPLGLLLDLDTTWRWYSTLEGYNYNEINYVMVWGVSICFHWVAGWRSVTVYYITNKINRNPTHWT